MGCVIGFVALMVVGSVFFAMVAYIGEESNKEN